MSHALIIERAAEFSGYSVATLRGPARHRPLCMVRWAVMANLRTRGLSFATIGRILNRDHATIISGLHRADELRADPDFSKIRSAIA